jgi:phosphate/sulfate permease
MPYIIFWIVIAGVVGAIAYNRGRSGWRWFLIALLISPLLAGIILLLLPDLEERVVALREKYYESLKISGVDFLNSMNKFNNLFQKNVLTQNEFEKQKLKLINNLHKQNIDGTPEDFLDNILPLLEKKILSSDEMKKIKKIVLDKNE